MKLNTLATVAGSSRVSADQGCALNFSVNLHRLFFNENFALNSANSLNKSCSDCRQFGYILACKKPDFFL